MKLPDPFFHLCNLRTGTLAVAFIHCLTTFHLMARFIDRLVPMNRRDENMIQLNAFVIVLLTFGLVFNFILHVVLIGGIMKGNLTVFKAYLVLGPFSAGIWIGMVYYLSGCVSCAVDPLDTSCLLLNGVGIIYLMYVYYVMIRYTAYTVALGNVHNLLRRFEQRDVNAKASVESGLIMDKNNNPGPGKLVSAQAQIESLIQAPPGIQLKQ